MPVVINILAYLAIFTLLGFVGVIAWGALTMSRIVAEVKGDAKIIHPPKQAALGIVNAGKGIALHMAQRGKTIAGKAKEAAASVTAVKDDIAKVAKSIDVEDVKSSAQDAADSVRAASANDAAAFVKEVISTFQQASAAQKTA